jgi:predicted nucleic acid-binding protein
MIGLDCNILVQLALADHPANARTLAVVQSEIGQREKLVFPSLIVAEFLHVVTDAKRFAPPLTMPEALDWMRGFSRQSGGRPAGADQSEHGTNAALDAAI